MEELRFTLEVTVPWNNPTVLSTAREKRLTSRCSV